MGLRQIKSCHLREVLSRLLKESEERKISMKELIEAFSEKGSSVVIMFFSLPFCLPIQLPGLSTAFGLIIGIISITSIWRKELWLPKSLLDKTIPHNTLIHLLNTGIFLLDKLQRFSHPRMISFCNNRLAPFFNGLLSACLAFILALPLPLPFSNLLAAWPLVLLHFGLVEEDALFVSIAYGVALFCLGLFGLLLLGSWNWFFAK